MALTRNSNNLNTFGHFNGIGGDIECFTIDAGATLANETNPGEAMDFITRCIEEKCTIVAIGAEDSNGGFRLMVQGSLWTAGTLQAALRLIGASANGTNVGTNNYNASGATATAFVF